MTEKAGKITGISQNLDPQHFISLIHRCQFDELRDHIARLASTLLTYGVIVPKYDFSWSDSRIINILRELDISNDLYSVTLQCYSCCTTFTTVIQIGSTVEPPLSGQPRSEGARILEFDRISEITIISIA